MYFENIFLLRITTALNSDYSMYLALTACAIAERKHLSPYFHDYSDY